MDDNRFENMARRLEAAHGVLARAIDTYSGGDSDEMTAADDELTLITWELRRLTK
jgi:hypothetical protein